MGCCASGRRSGGTAAAPLSRYLSRPVCTTPLAEGDIARAQDNYEAREAGLGNRFVEQVRNILTRISQNPFQYQSVMETRDARARRCATSHGGSGIASSLMKHGGGLP